MNSHSVYLLTRQHSNQIGFEKGNNFCHVATLHGHYDHSTYCYVNLFIKCGLLMTIVLNSVLHKLLSICFVHGHKN